MSMFQFYGRVWGAMGCPLAFIGSKVMIFIVQLPNILELASKNSEKGYHPRPPPVLASRQDRWNAHIGSKPTVHRDNTTKSLPKRTPNTLESTSMDMHIRPLKVQKVGRFNCKKVLASARCEPSFTLSFGGHVL